MRKRLIFRVDDLGYTQAYDLGAVRAFDEGIASSADIMLDSPHTVEILQWVKERPWLSIGWHRHLWESPVLPPEEVPSLVDERGRFKWGHRHPERMAEATYEVNLLKGEYSLVTPMWPVPGTRISRWRRRLRMFWTNWALSTATIPPPRTTATRLCALRSIRT